MKHRYFVAGTDTEVGKTFVTASLLAAAQNAGMSTLGLKPIAAGGEMTASGLRNEDAVILKRYSSVERSYEQHNPICLNEAIAPHIAAANEGRLLSVSRVAGICRGAMSSDIDLTLIEGAGGWRVPLGPRETMADLAAAMNFGVILVVGMRLGCLNHALLTAEAIIRDGLKPVAWVANQIDPHMTAFDENLGTLQSLMPCPMLANIPYQAELGIESAASELDISVFNELGQA